MELKKEYIPSYPAFIERIVELTRLGYEIDIHQTRSITGLMKQLTYYKPSDVAPAVVDADVTFEAELVTYTEDELKELSIPELRDILTKRGVKFAPAAKEAKLIELILA